MNPLKPSKLKFYIFLILLIVASLELVFALPQCSDGIDNDGDGKIDTLVELNPDNGLIWYSFNDPFSIRSLVNSKKDLFGYIKIPDQYNGAGALNNDEETAKQVCKIAGYSTLISYSCYSAIYGRCGWASCNDNFNAKWNSMKKDFDLINACSAGNLWLSNIYCKNKLAKCNDGIDNDGDGKIDYPQDDGCVSPWDDDERVHDPECKNKDDFEYEVICSKNEDCDDNNDYTLDKCLNPGTQQNTCIHERIKCINDNDCGFTGFFGNEFCFNNDIFKNYQKAKCINPKTTESYCTIEINQLLIKDCGESYCENFSQNYCKNNSIYTSRICYDKGCSDGKCFQELRKEEKLVESCSKKCYFGSCVECIDSSDCEIGSICINKKCVKINCSKDSDCDDNNVSTEDKCVNPGTVDSYCKHYEIKCFKNSDCGIDGFVDGLFCKNNSVYQNFVTFKCNNPGTSGSYCSNSSEARLKLTCTANQSCYNGSCKDIACFKDSDCGENRFLNQRFCQNNSVYDIYLNFRCLNPGTIDSKCYNISENRNIENCSFRCLNGLCLSQCYVDSDCGEDYYSEKYCDGREVYKDFFDFSCKNGVCVKEKKSEFLEECKDRCYNGKCVSIKNPFVEEQEEIVPVFYTNVPENYTFFESKVERIGKQRLEEVKTNEYGYWLIIMILVLLIITAITIIVVSLKK